MYKTENGVLRVEVVYQNSLRLLQTLQRASFSRLCDPGLPWKFPILVKACGQRCLWDGRAVCLLGSSGMWVMDVLREKEMTDWSHKPFECTFFLHCLKQYQNWGNLLRDPAGRWALEVIHAADSCTGGFVIFIKQNKKKNGFLDLVCFRHVQMLPPDLLLLNVLYLLPGER